LRHARFEHRRNRGDRYLRLLSPRLSSVPPGVSLVILMDGAVAVTAAARDDGIAIGSHP